MVLVVSDVSHFERYEKFGLDGEVQIVALNDLTDAKTNAHLLELIRTMVHSRGQ